MISATISDSRTVSPCALPGQSLSGLGLTVPPLRGTTVWPAWICSIARTSSSASIPFDR